MGNILRPVGMKIYNGFILKLSFYLFFFLTAFNGGSQNYFSVTTYADKSINQHVDFVQFNSKNYIIESEYCDGPASVRCGKIVEIKNDGSTKYVKDIGDINLFDNAAVVDGNLLSIVGQLENENIQIIQYHANLNQFRRQEVFDASIFSIYDFESFGDYFVVAGLSYSSTGLKSKLYWINKSDLSLDTTIIDYLFFELEVNNGLLKCFTQEPDGIHIVSYDSNRKLIDDKHSTEPEFIPYGNFKVLNNGDVVYGLAEKKYLKYLSLNGTLLWQIDIAGHFGLDNISGIRQIKTLANGDILLCGTIFNEDQVGFMCRVSVDGNIVWAHVYNTSNVRKCLIDDVIELSSNELLFLGLAKQQIFNQNSFFDIFWVLKTDEFGCINGLCGNYDLTTSTAEVENLIRPSLILGMNPISYRQLEYRADNIPKYSILVISDMSGRILLNKNIEDQETISLSNYIPGLYFISLMYNGKCIQNQKFIIPD